MAQNHKLATRQYLVGIAMHIIGLVLSAQLNRGAEPDVTGEKIKTAISIMNRNVNEEIDLIQIASDLNMSYSHFRKEFKKRTGTSPNQYFQNLKMKSAKNMIFSTNLPVKEICYRLGYSSPEYFTNQFRKHVGKTPMEYRRFTQGKEEE